MNQELTEKQNSTYFQVQSYSVLYYLKKLAIVALKLSAIFVLVNELYSIYGISIYNFAMSFFLVLFSASFIIGFKDLDGKNLLKNGGLFFYMSACLLLLFVPTNLAYDYEYISSLVVITSFLLSVVLTLTIKIFGYIIAKNAVKEIQSKEEKGIDVQISYFIGAPGMGSN